MLLGALTGMRLEEIFRLKVSDCAGGVFQVRRSKTASGERQVPIHADLVEVVERRCKGKHRGTSLSRAPRQPDGMAKVDEFQSPVPSIP